MRGERRFRLGSNGQERRELRSAPHRIFDRCALACRSGGSVARVRSRNDAPWDHRAVFGSGLKRAGGGASSTPAGGQEISTVLTGQTVRTMSRNLKGSNARERSGGDDGGCSPGLVQLPGAVSVGRSAGCGSVSASDVDGHPLLTLAVQEWKNGVRSGDCLVD